MKKLLLTLSVCAAMVACSKDETISTPVRSAITFGEAFIENSTRVPIDNSYTTTTLRAFDVYGTITNTSDQTANIFNQVPVTSSDGNTWSYPAENAQYWIPGNTYNFVAIADGNAKTSDATPAEITSVETDSDGMPETITLNDNSQQKDILYAESKNVSYSANDGAKTVEFTFSHLLSKVMFTVKNTIDADTGYSYKIGNVKITHVAKKAEYDIANGTWSEHAEENLTLNFGNIVADNINSATENADAAEIDYGKSLKSNYERLIIPTAEGNEYTFNILFDYYLYKDDVLVQTIEDKSLTANNILLEKGNAYNFVIKLGNPGQKIEFSVQEVNSWDSDINNDDEVNEEDNTNLN